MILIKLIDTEEISGYYSSSPLVLAISSLKALFSKLALDIFRFMKN